MTTVLMLRTLLISFLSLLILLPMPASAEIGIRSCTVKEVLKGGMYVYIRCQEGNAEVWLATVDRAFKSDEVISFQDVPPMTNFFSKHLNRTFPAVILTDIMKAGDKVQKTPGPK